MYDERRKSLLASLQEHVGETASSTTWALMWLADVEKLQVFSNQSVMNTVLRDSLTDSSRGPSIIAKCTVEIDPAVPMI